MNNKKIKVILFLILMMTITFLISGCDNREKETKKLAEDYLEKLKMQVTEDSLSLSDEVEHYGEVYAFIVNSKKYADDFRIYVNADDSITDSYFAVSLKEPTKQEFFKLLNRVLPDINISFELSLNKSVMSSELSGRLFNSIHEAHTAVDNNIGLIQITLSQTISEENLDTLLKAMKDEGFYGDLNLKDDERVFHITNTEINYTRKDDPAGEVKVYEY